ncbi:MAG: Flp pilus assembly protein CpaB [Planctomycetota bacterium]|jgi:pilus assembly protein CpaB
MKGKAIIPLALGLCIGLIAVKVGIDAVKKAKGSVAETKKITVVRAKLDLAPYQKIQEEMLEVVEVTDNSLIPVTERLGSVEEVMDRVTAKAVPMHSPILKSMLAPPGTAAGMVGRIPKGFRAVSVKIDEVTGVAYQIQPGDWVDVIVVMDVNKRSRREQETIAEVILQNVQVAAIGQDSANVPKGASSGVKSKPAKSATLFVKNDDAPKLHLAATRGKITLAMRGDDTDTTDDTMVRDSDAFEFLRRQEAEREAAAAAAAAAASTASKNVTPTTQVMQEPEEEIAHSVVISHGSTDPTVAHESQVITFEGPESGKVIQVRAGLTSGGNEFGLNKSRRNSSRRQSNRMNRAPVESRESREKQSDNDPSTDYDGE